MGIDYAGPILVKSGPVCKPVLKKSYAAVFICFTTKAVHLELVFEPRGIPSIIWSDHGTNFVGAERELRKLLWKEGSDTAAEFYTSQKIKWSFTSEHTPHFGELWEAAAKSFRLHVKKVLGEVKLNFEEFSTVLVQVEACLNSRPLTPLPDKSNTLEVLAPGHFLIGRPLTPDEESPL